MDDKHDEVYSIVISILDYIQNFKFSSAHEKYRSLYKYYDANDWVLQWIDKTAKTDDDIIRSCVRIRHRYLTFYDTRSAFSDI